MKRRAEQDPGFARANGMSPGDDRLCLPHQPRRAEAAREFPLRLMPVEVLPLSGGNGAHLPYLQQIAGAHLFEHWESWVEIHPDTAREYSIGDGDQVWIESRRGRVQARARLYAGVRRDVVHMPLGYGRTEGGDWANRGANPLSIIETEYEPVAGLPQTSNRVDVLAQYDLTNKLSISGFFGTSQDDLNRRSLLTSLTPLGDVSLINAPGPAPTPIYGPYYAYGPLKDISWIIGGDVDYILNQNVTLFAEYARERYYTRIVQRQRSKGVAAQVGCAPGNTSPSDCDPINDWTSASKDVVDTYLAGADLNFQKKVSFSAYYSLAAAKGNLRSNGVNCQIVSGPDSYCRTNFPNWRLDTSANPAATFDFPETVSRLHEVAAIARFKLSNNFWPKFQYRYQQFDIRDFQTSVMNPFAFVGRRSTRPAPPACKGGYILGRTIPATRPTSSPPRWNTTSSHAVVNDG